MSAAGISDLGTYYVTVSQLSASQGTFPFWGGLIIKFAALAIQTAQCFSRVPQESDEYLKAALDDERVSLSKLEYDSIVEGERRQQQELEHLKCEKEQLMLECDSLKDKIRTFTTRWDSTLVAVDELPISVV